MARELHSLFPSAPISIVDKEHDGDPNSQILVVTSYWYEAVFQPFKKLSFQAVIQIDADTPLYSTSPTAVQSFMQSLWQWRSVAYACRAPYYIQTSSSKLASHILDHPIDASKDELAARVDYHLPPVYQWARVSYRDDESRKTEIAIEQLKKIVSSLPESTMSAISRSHDGTQSIEVGVPLAGTSQLLDIFTTLDDRYIIDTDVHSG